MAVGCSGTMTSAGPHAATDNTAGITSERGGRRNTPPPTANSDVVAGDWGDGAVPVRRSSGRVRIARSGPAVTRKGRMRRAAHRTDAHSASSKISRPGPWPVTLAIDLS